MSQASQRVSKLSRRPGRVSRLPPAPELPDLDTSDDFTPSLSFARTRARLTLSQSSCAAEPSSSQSQHLSGDVSAPPRSASLSFCGVPVSGDQRTVTGDLRPLRDREDSAGDVRKPSGDDENSSSSLPKHSGNNENEKSCGDVPNASGSARQPCAPAARGRRTRRATQAATRGSRSSRSTRQSSTASSASAGPDGSDSRPTIDLSRFARTVPSSSAALKPGHPSSAASESSTAKEANPAAVPVSPIASPSPSVDTPPSLDTLLSLDTQEPAPLPSLAPPASTSVPDCPICLHPLPSTSARLAHLKLCGERRGLTPAQLLAAVRLQQKQAGERAAAGLPVARTAAAVGGRRTRTGQQGRRRGASTSTSAPDADLQLALAVSASLRDEQERSRRRTEAQLLELGLGEELEAARRERGVPPAPETEPPPAAEGPARARGRGGRRRPVTDAVTALTTQSREERERRLCEKVAQLLAWEEEVPAERRLRPRRGATRPAPAWQKAAQLDSEQDAYYVPELADQVEKCTAPVTSLLRDVADIPGRISLTQQVRVDSPSHDCPASSAREDDRAAAADPEDGPGATQAALLLLAGDSASSQPDSESESLPPPAVPGDSEGVWSESAPALAGPADSEDAESESESVPPPAGSGDSEDAQSESESVAPPADDCDSEAALVTAEEMAPSADSREEAETAGGVAERDSVDGRMGRGCSEAGGRGGDPAAKGLVINGGKSRHGKSFPTRIDGCSPVSGSPSKRARVAGFSSPVHSVPSGDRAKTSPGTNGAHAPPLPTQQTSNGEDKTQVSPATPKSDGRKCSNRGEDWPRAPAADAGQSSDQSVSTVERKGRAEPASDNSTPRYIPSTPDSGSPVPLSPAADPPRASPSVPPNPTPTTEPRRPPPASPGRSPGDPCFTSHPSNLGAALLDLLLTDSGPPASTLLCADGAVSVHPAVAAVRCPALYRALTEAGGRLAVPEVTVGAAAALVRVLYLGGTECEAAGTPLPQLLLLAERFEMRELAWHLRWGHGVLEALPVDVASAGAPPLSPELFDLTGSDGAEQMEVGSPGGDAGPRVGPEGGRPPRRGSDSVVCTPCQSPERGGNSSPARTETTPQRRERATAGDKTPVRNRSPSPVVLSSLTAGDATTTASSAPRRGRKRPSLTPRQPGSSEDICEVFSSLPKRRRTASPTGQSASRQSQEVQSASPATRQPRGASQERVSGSQQPRPGSADSDIQILDDEPVVFTQRVKSPRRSSGGRGEVTPGQRRGASQRQGSESPVMVSKETSSSNQRGQSEGSLGKTPSKGTRVQEQSEVEDVTPLSSPAASQTLPRRQSEIMGDSFGLSPVISRRPERDSVPTQKQPSTPSSSHQSPKANGTDSPAPSQPVASTPGEPVTDGNVAAESAPPPYSPELPVMSPVVPRSPGASSSPPSPQTRLRSASPASRPPPGEQQTSASPPASPSERGSGGNPSPPGSPVPEAAPSPPADLPPADVWEGFEDGGYIELMEAPPLLGSPLRPPGSGDISSSPTGSKSTPGGISNPARGVSTPGGEGTTAQTPPKDGPRSSLDSSDLWQDSSLLAGYATPTAAESTRRSRQEDGSFGVRSSNAESSRDQQSDKEASRARTSNAKTSKDRSSGDESSKVPASRKKASKAPPSSAKTPTDQRSGSEKTAADPDEAGTPDTAPAPQQRTPVNPYRVVLRDSNTPMPNYVIMLTPELKRELVRIGVKPISRRKAVALLSHIYEETHPPAPPARTNTTASRPPPSVSAPASDGEGRFARPREPAPAPAREPRSRTDSGSDSESSGSEGAAARLEEVFGRLGRRLEQEEEEEEITASQAASAASLPEVLRSFILARPELYRRVLTYEPLWLESLHRDLKQSGVKLNIGQLMDFLDEQCITFRTENSGRRRKSPKKKSPKKGSPKKRGPSQKKKSTRKKTD